MAVSTSEAINKKRKMVEELIKLGEVNSIIGIANLEGISSRALQGIRLSLRKGDASATIKVAKNTLKRLAIEEMKREKKGIEKLEDYISGSCAFIFSNSNPFKLQKFLNKNQVPAPAKSGQISPVEVTVPAGTTNLDPGPVISEFGSLGIETRIEKGKIKIVRDTKVLSPGDKVTEIHASVLSRLGIQPFKIGLKINAIFEEGEIIPGEALDFDEEQILSDLRQAYMNALALGSSPKVAYYTKETIVPLLQRIQRETMTLAVETEYISKDTIESLLIRAIKEAKVLDSRIE